MRLANKALALAHSTILRFLALFTEMTYRQGKEWRKEGNFSERKKICLCQHLRYESIKYTVSCVCQIQLSGNPQHLHNAFLISLYLLQNGSCVVVKYAQLCLEIALSSIFYRQWFSHLQCYVYIYIYHCDHVFHLIYIYSSLFSFSKSNSIDRTYSSFI